MSFAPGVAAAFLVVLHTLLFDTAAQAQEVEIGPSLICDSEKQVQRFIALYDGDTRATINAVNREANDAPACGVVTTAYVRGPQLANAEAKTKVSASLKYLSSVSPMTTEAWNPLLLRSSTRCFRLRRSRCSGPNPAPLTHRTQGKCPGRTFQLV